MELENPKIIQTDSTAVDGKNRCPKCGSTDFSFNHDNGKLKCRYCRYEFDHQKLDELEDDVAKLDGIQIGSGASDIADLKEEIVTFKCDSCGAEVVVDLASSTQAKCHWCRSILSVNKQVPNGLIPDMVLPFKISKEEAEEQIREFVKSRSFYADKKFKKNFTTENIVGVYFPYMVVDINAHARYVGSGEHLVREYEVEENDHKVTKYDADLYNIEREFDIAINDLTVESNLDLISANAEKTNNVINAIMPFDTENCVKYNSNYLKGYTSEKRDMNVSKIEPLVKIQAEDVSRHSANTVLTYYDRGVCFNREEFNIIGQQWASAYLPVWLYSYQEVKKDKKTLHYVAVNARTKETMGSIPVNIAKLVFVSFLIEILAYFGMRLIDSLWGLLFFIAGFVYFFVEYNKCRNIDKRHSHERETKFDLTNLKQSDVFIEHRRGLTTSTMTRANNHNVYGINKNKQDAINDPSKLNDHTMR